jgi:plasmid stabilization system protein ParE
MAGAEWTSRARRSMQEIARYIARESGRPKVAEKLSNAIRTKAEAYGRQPTMGSLHEGLPENFRYFIHKRYVIVYEALEDGILVHLIADSARDWIRLFH